MDFKCKYCGSVNLELEEKGNQTGLYCCDCGKWLKWLTKEEKRVFDNKNGCNPFYVPNGATNGDMFKAMFSNLKVEDNGGSIYLHYPNGGWIVFDRDWWNAPYKRESEEKNENTVC